MTDKKQPSRLKVIKTISLVCCCFLGCGSLILSGYLFHKAKENSKSAKTTPTAATFYTLPNSEHTYTTKDLSTGVYQFPENYIYFYAGG